MIGYCRTFSLRAAFLADAALIAVLWGLGLLMVLPLDNFPVNDDWAYALAVKHLLEQGDYHPNGWQAMSLFSNVLWGALFCKIFGYSFTILRLSTELLSLLGGLASYGLARVAGLGRWPALLAVFCLIFNPVYYSLSDSFMTDVPFTAAVIVAALCYVRYLQSSALLYLVLAALLSLLAILSRQLAVALPVAFAITLLWGKGLDRRTVFWALAPLLVCGDGMLIFHNWLVANGIQSNISDEKSLVLSLQSPAVLAHVLGYNVKIVLLYYGLFLLPVLLPAACSAQADGQGLKFWLITVGTGLAILLFGSNIMMPAGGNILDPSGIGPVTVRESLTRRLHNPIDLPEFFWEMITMASLAGGGMLVAALMRIGAKTRWAARGWGQREMTLTFLLLLGLTGLLPLLLLSDGLYDRHLVPQLPFLMIAILLINSEACPRAVSFVSLTLVLCLAIFSLAATHDFLAWQRTRWNALQQLTDIEKISPAEIDGGFEFNGLLFFDTRYRKKEGKSWWWVQDDQYVISNGDLPGYDTVYDTRYPRWLPPYEGDVTTLRRHE